MGTLRSDLPELPTRIKALPVDHRGYPVPWFVAWIDGKPDFRVADARKRVIAVNEHRCWICGERLGTYLAFVIGPMCAVNRISSEPPSHRDCAEFSARACPFLARPHAKRREAGLPETKVDPAGIMLERNPGVALIWITKGYRIIRTADGILFEVGPPREWLAFAEGRRATPEELQHSIVTGLPLLREIAENDPKRGAIALLNDQIRNASRLLGVELPYTAPKPSELRGSASRMSAMTAMAAITAVAGLVE